MENNLLLFPFLTPEHKTLHDAELEILQRFPVSKKVAEEKKIGNKIDVVTVSYLDCTF